jgi:hypothetical protein
LNYAFEHSGLSPLTTSLSNQTCPVCSVRLGNGSISLWDGRDYCADCVRRASSDLYAMALAGESLSDVIEPRHVGAWKFIRYIGKWYLIAVLVFFGIPLGMGVAFGNMPIEGLLLGLGFVGVFGLLFLGAQGLLGAFVHRRGLPREITVASGTVTITTPRKVETLALDGPSGTPLRISYACSQDFGAESFCKRRVNSLLSAMTRPVLKTGKAFCS